MRFRTADLFRVRSAMNAIAGFVEPDPGHPDRIIWPRRQDQLGFQISSFGRLRKFSGSKV
jgi:hypothetical protein